ncbi:hypothetical protein AOLI_G00041570, partial [Acnodon oligacanthus]
KSDTQHQGNRDIRGIQGNRGNQGRLDRPGPTENHDNWAGSTGVGIHGNRHMGPPLPPPPPPGRCCRRGRSFGRGWEVTVVLGEHRGVSLVISVSVCHSPPPKVSGRRVSMRQEVAEREQSQSVRADRKQKTEKINQLHDVVWISEENTEETRNTWKESRMEGWRERRGRRAAGSRRMFLSNHSHTALGLRDSQERRGPERRGERNSSYSENSDIHQRSLLWDLVSDNPETVRFPSRLCFPSVS